MCINIVGYVGGTLTFYIGHGLVKLRFVYRWIEKMKQSEVSGFRIDKNTDTISLHNNTFFYYRFFL